MTAHRRLMRIGLIALALAAGAAPAAHARAPTRLWYRLHIAYTAKLHTEQQWYDGTRYCCYQVTTGAFHDERVHWTADSEGSVLVRVAPRGNWSVYHGVLLGTLHQADITDRTTYEAAGEPDGSTFAVTDCSTETDGTKQPAPPGVTDFRDDQLFISTALGQDWFPEDELQAAFWVKQHTHSTGDINQCNQVCCGGDWVAPDDETKSYPSPMPIVPDFGEGVLAQLRGRRPRFGLRGRKRFGAKHVVLASSGQYQDGPHTAPYNPTDTGGAFPLTHSWQTSCDEQWTLVLDRCPGRGPC